MAPSPLDASSRRALAATLLAAAIAGCSSGSSAPGPGPGPSCSLPAAESLSVVEVTPPNGATGVYVGATVSLRFNTCLDPTTITATNFLLSSFGFVSRSLHHDAATGTVTIQPSASLAYDTLYLVAVSGVKGTRGETMATPFGSSFRTQRQPETVPPTTTAAPPGGHYNATQHVALTCSDNPGGTGCAATYYTLDGSPPTPLSARYTAPIAIAASATLRFFSVDMEGNVEPAKEETYVIDKVPPTLTASDPADGAGEVPVTKVFTATFSEAMDPSSLTPATVTVDGGVTVTVSYDADTSTLAIVPTERLACNTTHRVSIGAAATDLAGNGLVQPATFSFTTVADCEEPVTTASVPGGAYRTDQSVTLTCADAGGSGCARIVYTTDGSIPSFDPPNGVIVAGASAGPIAIGEGDTELLYFSEDAGGNREVLRRQLYSVSRTGFTFVATNDGLARGVGPVPASFVPFRPGGDTLVFHRDASNGRLYRGTERGLLFSEGGEAWTFATEGFVRVLSVLAQGSKIYAGTSGGLLVSTDGGATFSARDLGASSAGWVKSVVASDRHVYAATDKGVAVSADKGRTFTMRTVADGLGSTSVRALVLDGGTLYAATGGGVSISTDGGATFTNHTAGLTNVSVNALAVSGTTVYAGTDAGLFVSTDGGETYSVLATTADGLGSDYVGTVVLAGTTLYLGTGEPWASGTSRSFAISTDGGDTFTTPLVSPQTDPDLRIDTVFVEGATVRVGAHPSYYLSTDGGATFEPWDLRGALTKVTGAGTTLYAAVEDSTGHGGVAVSTDGGASFVLRGKDAGLAHHSVEDVFATGSNVYAATFWGVGFSDDGGATFVNHATTGSSNSGCVYASGTTVWACGATALQVSTDGGPFSVVQAGTGGGVALAVSGDDFYLATSNGLWVSNEGGASGTFVLRGTNEGLGNTYLSDVAVDANGTVLATASSSGGPNGFYFSTDDGASFSALGTTIWARGVYAYGTTWYAATYQGVGISTDGGATWVWRGTAEGVPGPANDAWYMP